MMKSLRDALAFLSIIPAGGRGMREVSHSMAIFPIAGLVIGGIVGVVSYGVSLYLDGLVVGLVAAAGLAIITGLHHIDGLGDFADGLMADGSARRRLEAMRDKATGTAGTAAILLSMIGVVVLVSQMGHTVIYAIIWCEALAKYSMVLLAYLGRGVEDGSGRQFCEAASGRRIVLATALLVPVAIICWLMGMPGWQFAVSSITVVATVFVILALSRRRFGGITGDILGANNEICRIVALGVLAI